MRRLAYVAVESGRCWNCGKDAGDHSIEGICGPRGTQPVDADIPRPCYRGQSQHAFIDLDSPRESRQLQDTGVA